MSDARDSIEKFAARLADGKAIDWDDAKVHLSPEKIEQLRKLEQLTQLMRTAGDSHEAAGHQLEHWGHLQIVERLGHGQFGEVFRAFDPVLQRDVALKLSRNLNTSSRPQAWIDEARQLARVRHPNVLAVHGADIHEDVPGLWADLVHGDTLSTEGLLTQRPKAERLALGLQLARALRAVHAQGLAHGDIKPANIMIEANKRAILMDFGSSRDLESASNSQRSTGTPLFMAPERLDGARASRPADVFALGAVFSYLLTGQAPFQADTLEDLRAQQPQGVARALKNASLTRAERRLIQSMLDVDPERRPDIEVILYQLKNIIAGPARRRRLLAVATIIGLLVTGLSATTIGYLNVRQAEQETAVMNDLLRDVLAAPRGTELGREARVVDVLDRALFQAERRFDAQPEVLARVQALVGGTLQTLAQYEQAGPILQQAFEHNRDRFGLAHPRTLSLLNPMAQVEKALGNIESAESLWQQVLDEARLDTSLGRNEAILAHVGLANLAMERNDLAAALDRLTLAQDLDQDKSSEQATLVAQMLRSLVLIRAGRFSEAESVATELLSASLSLHGPRHINTLVARERLIEIKVNLDELEAAESLARDNMEIALDWLGEGDPYTVSTQTSLSIILAELGRTSESLALLDAAIAGAEQAFPADTPNALALKVNRAARYLELGQAERAIELAEVTALQLAESPAPVGQLIWLNGLNLAEALYQNNQFEASNAQAGAVRLEILEALGEAHPLTQIAASYEGAALTRLGRFDDAVALLDPAVEQLSATLGEVDAQSLMARAWQALNLNGLGQASAARTQMNETLASARATLGDDHYRVRDIERLAARLLPAETP